MWTKREFPTERVDKLMENCLRQFTTSLPTLIHPLTTFRRSKHFGMQGACGATITIYEPLKGKGYLNFLINWSGQWGVL
jgi:hypothetical protein